MEEIDEFLGINNGIENMVVDEQGNGANDNRDAFSVADGLQPNNIIPIDQQGVNARAGVLNQPANMQQQENAGNQGAQLPQNIVQANNLRGGNGVQVANAGNQAARLPPGIAANDQGNNVPGGNQVQVEDPGLRQGQRPVQGQHGQQSGAGVLQNINGNQRINRREANRNFNRRSAPYNPNAARLRRKNFNNLAQLLMSMAKQGAYVPAHYNEEETDENHEETQ